MHVRFKMTAVMNILILTHHRLMSSLTGATTRILSLAKELARIGNQVTILSLISPRYAAAKPISLAERIRILKRRIRFNGVIR